MTDEPDMEAALEWAKETVLLEGHLRHDFAEDINAAKALLKLYGESNVKRQRRKRIPADWNPNSDGHGYWIANAPSGETIEETIFAFKNHHIQKGTVMLDWDRAWQTWCRNAKKFAEERRRGQVQRGPSSIAEAARSVSEAIDRRSEQTLRPQDSGSGDCPLPIIDSIAEPESGGRDPLGGLPGGGTYLLPAGYRGYDTASVGTRQQMVPHPVRDTGRMLLEGTATESVAGEDEE